MIYYNIPGTLDDMDWEMVSEQGSIHTPPSSQLSRHDYVFDHPISRTISDAGYSSMSSEPFSPVNPPGLGLFLPSLEIDGYCDENQHALFPLQAQMTRTPIAVQPNHGLQIIAPPYLAHNVTLGDQHHNATHLSCAPWDVLHPPLQGPSPLLSPACSNYSTMSYHSAMQSPCSPPESRVGSTSSPHVKIEPRVSSVIIPTDQHPAVKQSPQGSPLPPGRDVSHLEERIATLLPFQSPQMIREAAGVHCSHGLGGEPLATVATRAQSRSNNVRKKREYTTQENARLSCDVCGKLFQRKFNHRKHMETHQSHRVQPFACEYEACDKSFGRKTDLTRHEKSLHLRVRDHVCPMCDRSFTRKDTCGRHIDDNCRLRSKVKHRPVKSCEDIKNPVKRRLRSRLPE